MERLRNLLPIPTLNLTHEATWRRLLLVLFALAFFSRLLAAWDLGEHPVGRAAEIPGTEPWHFAQQAQRALLQEDGLLRIPGIMVTQPMARLAPPQDWAQWAANRAPRATPAVYAALASIALSEALGLYLLLSLAAGAALAPLAAAAGARVFRDRRAGFLAGIYAASQGLLVLAAGLPGPWHWDALLLAGILYAFLRLRDEPENPASWLLLGLLLGLGPWFRGMFLWGLVFLPLAAWRWRIALKPAMLVWLAAPVALLIGGLLIRNAAAQAPLQPLVGQPAWDYYRTTNPQSAVQASLPADVVPFAASGGDPARLLALTLGDDDWRAALGPVLARKLRELLGARDNAETINLDYLRRRAELHRLTTLRSDVTMAMAWAAALFLLALRLFPRALAPPLAIVLLHGLLFQSDGLDRAPIHLLACLLIGGALMAAADALRARQPAVPVLFLTLWAAAAWLLAVDDHARGSRYRANEFDWAIQYYEARGQWAKAELEKLDGWRLRQHELVFRDYWNQ